MNEFLAMTWVNLLANNSKDADISYQILTSIMNALDDGVYITDHLGTTLFVNDAYLKLTHLNREDLIDHPIQDLVNQGVFSRSVSMDVIQTHQKTTILQSLQNHTELLVTGHPVFDQENQLIAVITSVRDITVLLQAQKDQKELEDIRNTQKKYSTRKLNDNYLTNLSDSTNKTFNRAKRIAHSDIKILIQGNTGTGKTVLARFIHKNSPRKDQPFLEINCATMPDGLLESELFGYVPGAFTGALQKGKKGLFEVVNGGTLFLDEVGDLPLALQAKLLKVIEDNRFIPVGGFEYVYTDVRIISATHHDLLKLVEQGKFRRDLYYRLCVTSLKLEDLKNRISEIEPLLELYLANFNKKYHTNKRYSAEVIDLVKAYSWPGNIRELTNFVEQTVVLSESSTILPQDIPEDIQCALHGESQFNTPLSNSAETLKKQVDDFEFKIISRALAVFKTTQKAAQALGIDQSTLVKKRQRYQQLYQE
ncbi:sigma 54-interacting transcriptional regulator [Acinetobacter bereziniae]|uniref:HTH-type transcriptional regulatory protein TyrR n=1 Tax=Acinetobacter bereziniae TaxID=106648 RepID=A0A9E7PCW4_ACIBZ|nr:MULTISPECIES: sigma 54-interacting transcriptional regulator [Acinetobacter]MDQ9817458.1 sigma 54-interacting transcriptional regulator [Acinetobacter bereziniae]UUN97771.1 sigma 54-interacting transcriptional regulator [Acinetobacter bereziniae]